MFCWNRGMELLRLKSMIPEALSAHEDLRTGPQLIEHDMFSVKETKAAQTLGVENLYRIMGLYILEYQDAFYILDYSSLDQVHLVSKMWEGFYKYASNYRLCGMGTCRKEINYLTINKCKSWLCNAMEETNFSDKLARSMKQSLALLQNDMHEEAERLNINLQIKSQKLKQLISEIIPLRIYWHEFLRDLTISSRIQLDLANIFYALPAPDCNLKQLFERASVYMTKANIVDNNEFTKFMEYCMSVDLCKALTIYKQDVTYDTIPGYDIKNENWFKSCIKGKLVLPPDEDMGKAWMTNSFLLIIHYLSGIGRLPTLHMY